MKVTEKKLPDNKVVLSAIASPEEVNAALQQAHIGFAQTMGMKPEPGKTIEEAAKDQMGITDLDSIVEDTAIASLVPHALDKRNIIPAYMPKPKVHGRLKRDQEFPFELEVQLKPKYGLSSYDPVKIEAPEFFFDESLIDLQLDEVAARYMSYERDEAADDKPVESGDIVKMALTATEGGEVMKGLTTEGRTYVVGQGYMPPSFDEGLMGMRPGETKEFTFEGPGFDKDMNETTKSIDAKVTILEIQHEVKPTIDDEWIKVHLPLAKDLESMRADIRNDLEGASRMRYDAYIRELVAAEAAKRFEGKIADEVYESARDMMVRNLQQQLQNEGKTWDAFVEENGGEQQFSMMLMMQIRDMLVRGFTLDAIFEHNKMTLTDEDIEAACIAMNPAAPPDQLRHQMEATGQGFALRETAERLKANNWLVEHADITYLEDPHLDDPSGSSASASV